MDEADKPVLPSVAKFKDAVDAIKGMLAENLAGRDMVASLPAERQEQESQKLARDLKQIGVLANIVQGLVLAAMEGIKDCHWGALQVRLREALNVAKGMLAEFTKGIDMVAGLPPERQEQEAQKLHRDFEPMRALVKIVGDVIDGIGEGNSGNAAVPPVNAQ